MKASERHLDPAIAALIAEAVADPRSRIFRMTGTKNEARRRRSDELTPFHPRMIHAERHLLAVHREELGRFLREAFLIEFDRDQRATRDFSRSFESPAQAAWEGRLDSVARSATRLGERIDEDVRPSLDRMRHGWSGGPTAAQWASMALRVEACDEARIYAAAELLHRDQVRAAIQRLEEIARGPASVTNARCTWRNLGLAYLKLGTLGAALDAFEQAARIGRDDVSSYLHALAVAIHHGDGHRALIADGHANELAKPTDPAVRAFLQELETSPYLKARSPLRVRHTLSQIRTSLGPIGSEVAHAIRG